MAARKKVFLGSVFEFTDIAADELIRDFKDSHDDPEVAPFVSFEKHTQLFSAEVDLQDKETLPNLLARMSNYINFNLSHQPGFEDEPRIRAMEGTFIQDFIGDDKSYDNGLLEYHQSDEESEGQDALENLQHLIAYWKPRGGDIRILPHIYAQEITRLTGSSLFAEEAEKRYRLFHGDFHLAREKLLKLEPLLEIIKKQHGQQSQRASANLLIWPPNQKDARIEFVALTSSEIAYSRVIVNKMEDTLFRKMIGELRPWTSSMQFEIPENLQLRDISPTPRVQASRIWDNCVFQSFGDAKNMEPIITSNPSSTVNSVRTTTAPDSREAQIAAWTSRVVTGADPEIAPESPVEPAQASRRRVAVDSDSEDDEPVVTISHPKEVKKTSSPTVPETKSTAEDEHDTATLVSLLSPSKSTSKKLSEGRTARASRDGRLVGVGERAETSSTADFLADKFPVLPLTQASVRTRSQRGQHPSGNNSDPSARLLEDTRSLSLSDHPSRKGTFNSDPVQTPVSVNPEAMRDSLLEEAMPTTPVPPSSPHLTSTAQREGQANLSSPSPNFDPRAYGSPTKPPRAPRGQEGWRRGTPPRYGAHQRGGRGQMNYNPNRETGQQHQQRSSRGAPWPRGSNFRGRGSTGPGPRGYVSQSGPSSLIDIGVPDEPVGRSTPRVPPGFESHVPMVRSNSAQLAYDQRSGIMDDPSQSMPPPQSMPPTPQSGSDRRSSESRSRTSGESRLKFSEEGADYRATFIPKPNQAYIRGNSLRAALAAVEQENSAKSGKKKVPDEKPPPVRSTMHQQGPNPGKGSALQETKAQRKARLDKAMLEAYGPTPAKPPPKPPASTESQLREMSKWKKQQISKSPAFAEAHVDIIENSLRESQCTKFISLLEPLFEAGRAFSGPLGFEMSFGQVLVSPGPQLVEDRLYDQAGWSALFDSPHSASPTLSTFTRILTTNGADVDRALELKGPLGSGENSKLWHTPREGPQSVSYEFACQSRSNEDFLIVVDQSGGHQLRKGLVTVGMVNLHVPAQIWDASAILSGHLNWPDPPESLRNSAVAFVKSLYVVPDKEKLTMVFRQPSDHEIKVRNLIVKRVSSHRCLLPGGEDIQLKVTEAKSLFFKVHPQDKNLWQGYEADREDYPNLAHGGRIHYEMSLVHTGINEALAENQQLEIGELTRPQSTGASLLRRPVVRSMLDTTLHVLSKLDFMGMDNFGTLRRLDAETAERRRHLALSLGPAGQTVLQVPVAPKTLRTVAPSMSRYHSGESASHFTATAVPAPIPGVRMNTTAEIVQNPDGSRYALGMGGARIPLADDDVVPPRDGHASLMPDDSASQIGGVGPRPQPQPSPFQPPWLRMSGPKATGFW